MKAVNIAELKNNLSLYLRKVRAGQEVVVKDRDALIAKLIPWHGEPSEELLALANQGLVHLGKGQIDDEFWEIPVPRVSENALRRVMEAEGEDSW